MNFIQWFNISLNIMMLKSKLVIQIRILSIERKFLKKNLNENIK